jgi:hypothetical protein
LGFCAINFGRKYVHSILQTIDNGLSLLSNTYDDDNDDDNDDDDDDYDGDNGDDYNDYNDDNNGDDYLDKYDENNEHILTYLNQRDIWTQHQPQQLSLEESSLPLLSPRRQVSCVEMLGTIVMGDVMKG